MNLVEDIEGLVSNKIEIFKTIFAIVKLETRLVGLSIVPLILNIAMILVAVMTIWSSLMLVIGYTLMHWFSSFIVSVFGIMSFNVLIAFALFKYLSFNLKSMSFEKTRAYFNRRETQDVHIPPTSPCKAESTRKKTNQSSAKRKPI
ncbi:MAG: hypothetical protein NTU48_05040 [Legionellales bacterium]|nr:hypothetical protein [Legionellales bacterium]